MSTTYTITSEGVICTNSRLLPMKPEEAKAYVDAIHRIAELQKEIKALERKEEDIRSEIQYLHRLQVYLEKGEPLDEAIRFSKQ